MFEVSERKFSMKRKFMTGVLISLYLVTLLGSLQAQETTSAITGAVRDASGAPVPGAAVTVRNLQTAQARSVATDETGNYKVLSLPVGRYEVQVEKEGFQTFVRTGLETVVGQQAVVNIQLQVGEVQQSVTVTAEAPLVNATTTSIAGLVSEQEVKDLPLNGRSWDTLLTLNPGTSNMTGERSLKSAATGPGYNFVVSGNRIDFNNILMNGIEYTGTSAAYTMPGGVSGQLLGVDAVQEFNVLTNTYGAEYGKHSGAQVNVVTMSGTNQFHGDVFEFIRNSALDARNFFSVLSSEPPFKRNQFGGAAGGPIVKDKVFIFGNYEGFRQRLAESYQTGVPDLTARQGLLPNPTTGQLQNIGLAPGIAAFLPLWPLPNGPELLSNTGLPTGAAFFYSNPVQAIREDFGNIRADETLSAKDTLSQIYTVDDGQSLTPQPIPTSQTLITIRSQVASLQETHIFSPSTLSTFRFGFSRSRWESNGEPTLNPPGTSIIPGEPTPNITIGGSLAGSASSAFSAAGAANTGNQFGIVGRNLFTWADDVQISKSKHMISVGAWFQRVQMNTLTPSLPFGTVSFGSLQALLQGQSQGASATFNPAELPQRQLEGAWYVQDVIKLRPNLTVSLGLRHEFNNGWNSPQDMLANYIQGANGILSTQPVIGKSVYTENNAKWLFGPRVGVAWSPLARTAVRAGFGTYYNALDYLQRSFQANPITTPNGILNDAIAIGSSSSLVQFPLQLGANTPGAKPTPGGVQPNIKMATVEQWNLKIEQGITANTLFSVEYIGEHGFHLPVVADVNSVFPTPQANGFTEPFPTTLVRPNNSLAAAKNLLGEGLSSYNALQVAVSHRFSHGLQFRANYTYSKSMDNISVTYAGDSVDTPTVLSASHNLKYDWGPSDFNVTNRVSGNFSYQIPFGSGAAIGGHTSGIVNKVISGWSWNGIVTLQDGTPFSALAGLNRSNDGNTQNPDRASVNPNFTGPVILGNPNEWFNPNAFILQPPGFYGNVGRDTLVGPGLTELDMSLFKSTAITERLRGELRIEAFNLFNTANFGAVSNSVFQSNGTVATGAGLISSTQAAQRELQFGLKLIW
jgi:hypothetical protein